MFKYLKWALEEARRMKAVDREKSRLLEKNMDFAYLEQLIQKINENPLLRVRITMRDGTHVDLNTTPRAKSNIEYVVPREEYIEVK